MYTSIPLSLVAVVIGLFAIVTRMPGILYPEPFRRFWLKFPRSKSLGYFLMGLGFVWCAAIIYVTGFLEWVPSHDWRVWPVMAGLFLLVVTMVDEFLAVRGFSLLILLVARVMLDAAFMVDTPLRLVVTVLAYVLVVAGMVFTVSPHRMRDLLEFFMANNERCRLSCAGGVTIGVLLVALGVWVY